MIIKYTFSLISPAFFPVTPLPTCKNSPFGNSQFHQDTKITTLQRPHKSWCGWRTPSMQYCWSTVSCSWFTDLEFTIANGICFHSNGFDYSFYGNAMNVWFHACFHWIKLNMTSWVTYDTLTICRCNLYLTLLRCCRLYYLEETTVSFSFIICTGACNHRASYGD